MNVVAGDAGNAGHANEFGKVAVLMGGTSAEREISLLSGNAVLEALLRRSIDAHALDPAEPEFMRRLENDGYTRAFVALHGRGGEDGVIQGALEMVGIPYSGSGVLGSALAMDKVRSKQVWIGAGLPTPEFCVLHDAGEIGTIDQQLGYPLIVKPASEGSSLGISKVESQTELKEAVLLALEFDQEVLVELWVEGAEYTAAILGDKVLPLIRLETPRAFYDYEAKYHADSTRYLCPCGLSGQVEREAQQLAWEAFSTLGASGWGRVDFMIDEQDRPWLIEVNTVPGMTNHSLVPMAAKQAGLEFDELVWQLLETSIAEAAVC